MSGAIDRPDAPEPDTYWPALLAAGVGVGIAGAVYARKLLNRWNRGGGLGHMAERVIHEARRLATPIPPLDYVGSGDERWDSEVLGGKIGPDQWQWYEPAVSASGVQATTCAIFATAVLAYAGVGNWTSPLTGASGRLILNRPEPTGAGYKPGAWAETFWHGGDACGIRRLDPDLQPGDLYHIVRGGDPAKWHVGLVLARKGNQLTTADGGQRIKPGDLTSGQCCRISVRTLNGRTLSSAIASAGEVTWRLTWP